MNNNEKEYEKIIEDFYKLSGVPLEALREIDTHIRSTINPVPYIINTLKNTLPEYGGNDMSTTKKSSFIGFLGGDYEDLGLFNTQQDAERGICSSNKLHELLEEFKGKKVKITIEEKAEGI
jgi:hypothetical protein